MIERDLKKHGNQRWHQMPVSMPAQARMVVVIRAKHGYEYYSCVNWIDSTEEWAVHCLQL